jgi:8-oxo-dGTP diphosphatase
MADKASLSNLPCTIFHERLRGSLRLLSEPRTSNAGEILSQREFPRQPLVGVGAVVVNDDRQVLLIKRGTEPMLGHWSLPGGLLELGETLAEGVKREVFEETGLIVTPQAIVEVVDRIYRNSDGEKPQVRYHYVVVDFWCRVIDGQLKPSSDATDVAWVSHAEWKDSNFYSLDSIAVQVIEKGWQMAQEAGKCSGANFFGG